MTTLSEHAARQVERQIKKGSKLLNIQVSDSQADLMVTHAKELMTWNKKINLTAIKDPDKIAEKHFLDSIGGVSFFENGQTLIDLGSGGGFPGIPLKIMNPSLKVVLVDSSRKKVNFLKHVIRTLHLTNIDAVHSRVEDLHENQGYKNRFDAVISRAFTELEGFVNLASPFLRKGGTIYAMKGKHADKEMTSTILKKFKIVTSLYQLPFEKSHRIIIKLSAKR